MVSGIVTDATGRPIDAARVKLAERTDAERVRPFPVPGARRR